MKQTVFDELTTALAAVVQSSGTASEGLKRRVAAGARQRLADTHRFQAERSAAGLTKGALGPVSVEASAATHRREGLAAPGTRQRVLFGSPAAGRAERRWMAAYARRTSIGVVRHLPIPSPNLRFEQRRTADASECPLPNPIFFHGRL
jgi:hypothetical protein